MKELPLHAGFLLPYEVEASTQRLLIDFAKTVGESGGAFVAGRIAGEKQQSFWTTLRFRSSALGRAEQRLHKTDYRVRLKNSDWQWLETERTPLLRAEVEKIGHLYRSLHRVNLLLQNPNTTVPIHTDNVSPDQLEAHRANRFLAIKIPLTEIEGDNGRPIFALGEGRSSYQYDVGRRFFVINEMAVPHGALPTPHYRGVVFIDGILDLTRLESEAKEPIKIGRL